MSEYELLFEGPIGRMRPEDVLQFVSQAGGAVRVSFETEDRALGGPRGVDLEIDDGCLVGLGPRGTGLRFGELAVARGVLARVDLEALAAGDGPRLGERLVSAGRLDPAGLEDLLWERHARVVWSLLAWERGRFTVTSSEGPLAADRVRVDPPIALSALLLDGLQRAESALGADPDPT